MISWTVCGSEPNNPGIKWIPASGHFLFSFLNPTIYSVHFRFSLICLKYVGLIHCDSQMQSNNSGSQKRGISINSPCVSPLLYPDITEDLHLQVKKNKIKSNDGVPERHFDSSIHSSLRALRGNAALPDWYASASSPHIQDARDVRTLGRGHGASAHHARINDTVGWSWGRGEWVGEWGLGGQPVSIQMWLEHNVKSGFFQTIIWKHFVSQENSNDRTVEFPEKFSTDLLFFSKKKKES